MSSLSSIGPAGPPSIVTVVDNDWSVSGPSRVVVAAAQPKTGTGFGANGTDADVEMICNGVTPVLVNRHESVVSPIVGSHSAFAVYTAEGVAGAATARDGSWSSSSRRSSSVPRSSSVQASLLARGRSSALLLLSS